MKKFDLNSSNRENNFFCRFLLRCTELSSEKQKMTKHLRERDDECNQMKQKVDAFKMELKKLDKSKKEVDSKLEDVQNDLTTERRLREESQHTIAQLGKEIETLKSGGRKSLIENDLQIEIARYKISPEKFICARF